MTRIDAHVHVVADAAAMPMVAGRMYTPGPAPLLRLQDLARPAGVERFVVVQPSFYGTDNRVTLEAVAALGPRGRAVAVVDPALVTGEELAELHRRGVRGVRLNLYSSLAARQSGGLDESFGGLADVAARMGWHVEVLATLDALARHHTLLSHSAVPVVIDHYGLYTGHSPESDPGEMLLGLLQRPHVWMKLSAPYRCEADALATRPDPAWLRALLDVGGDRLVWGSDWPHTPPHELQTGGGVPLPYREIPYGETVAGFMAAVGDAAATEAILTGNPARLYEFA